MTTAKKANRLLRGNGLPSPRKFLNALFGLGYTDFGVG